jgi:hypothetical protein
MWTDGRTFLRSFKGIHKKYFAGYIAITEFKHNLAPTPSISALPWLLFKLSVLERIASTHTNEEFASACANSSFVLTLPNLPISYSSAMNGTETLSTSCSITDALT